ncbi:membrane-bound lytic murein transglycosylase MltC [Sodalis endosymbiont of Henestaris halophilus]|uniref:membrane-bound lytic murein transglycosylase MltC n=1 Tax=Sodalis endosymbiont of Henestaris halophilus TaxID=1929246 RepID=UPI000BBF4A96|nr:membrane-bound lytic murein transglycosylase MltC [Sodalis endosymbiont of Henestaris halophilus]SNC58834.1 Membrane-bound lytic murein transglycosylase C precursor [Sodalis endosymbiont of Henestaris halophilus]
MKKILFLFIIIPLLISCSSSKNNVNKEAFIKETNSFNILMSQFAHNIENLWGLNEILIAGPKDYVKYTNHYETRSHINFCAGTITVETISRNNTSTYLRQEIISTILMDNDPEDIDLYSDVDTITISKKPFFYGQVLDNKGEPIRWKWSATHFANNLLKTHLKTRIAGLRQIWYITIKLVPNHVDTRANKYLGMVRKASQQYGAEQSLILAIMQTESSFNPYAVSHADALGLMQVVQHSAGRDVFKMKGKWGQPSRRYLFDPKNNIDTGTAYLSILHNSYLGGIVNPTSRRYAVIAAYNSGAGSVLRVFSSNQNQAFQIINNMRPDEVYQMLLTQHPSLESRRYLYKVNKLQKKYWR